MGAGGSELELATELATNRKIKRNNPPHNSFDSPSEVVRLDQPGIVLASCSSAAGSTLLAASG